MPSRVTRAAVGVVAAVFLTLTVTDALEAQEALEAGPSAGTWLNDDGEESLPQPLPPSPIAQLRVRAGVNDVSAPAATPSELSQPAPLSSTAQSLPQPGRQVVSTPPRDLARADGRRPAALVPLYLGYATLNALDAHSTSLALSRGAVEANPVLSGVAGNRGAMIAVKAGVLAASITFAERMWKRGNRTAAVLTFVGLNVAQAFIVAHNYRVSSSLAAGAR